MATPNPSSVVPEVNQIQLVFTDNSSWLDECVLFEINAGGATMRFTQKGLTYQCITSACVATLFLRPLWRGHFLVRRTVIRNHQMLVEVTFAAITKGSSEYDTNACLTDSGTFTLQ